MNEHIPLRQMGLFEPRCQDCIAWELCKGGQSAPCHCIHRDATKIRKCEKCFVICKKRPNDVYGNFITHINDGLPLSQLRLSQPSHLELPILIPLRTNELAHMPRLAYRWIGIDVKTLLSLHRNRAATLKKYFLPGKDTRKYLKTGDKTDILVILNGQDAALEGFWAMQRSKAFAELWGVGICGVTGPTFSIASKGLPESHNVCMLLRHHRVMDEANRSGLLAIPNIYWRRKSDRLDWINWLKDSEVHIISRDFSRSKHKVNFMAELEGLLEIIEASKRKFHVLLIGVGAANATRAIPQLIKLGQSCSIVASFPIIVGIKGGQEIRFDEIDQHLIFEERPAISRVELARRNLRAFDDYLVNLVDSQKCEPAIRTFDNVEVETGSVYIDRHKRKPPPELNTIC